MLFHRTKRRFKGFFWSIFYFLQNKILSIRFSLKLNKLGISNAYIWEAFSFLAGLDMEDPMKATLSTGEEVTLFGRGLYLEMSKGAKRYTMQQQWGGQLYAAEWLNEVRKVRMEGGVEVETHWHEIYRSGRHINNPEFVVLLRQLYGEGPKDAERITGISA